MTTVYWKWRVVVDHPDAHRIPPWPMSEPEATEWARRWGCEVEKIEGTEFQSGRGNCSAHDVVPGGAEYCVERKRRLH